MDREESLKITRITAVVTILIAFSVLLGWIFNIPLLMTVFPGFVSMKLNTAICFMLTGTALYFSDGDKKRTEKLIVSEIPLIVVIAVSSLTLLEYLTGSSFNIDELFIQDHTTNKFPGRMASFTAMSFIFVGLGIILAKWNRKGLAIISQTLFHLASGIALLAILGYIYGIPTLYKWDSVSSIALHTSVLFLILSVGASFLHSEVGITGLFTGNLLGNITARRLFPPMFIVVVIIGFFRLKLHELHLVSVEYGGALLLTSFISILLFQIWLTAKYLNRIDKKRNIVEAQLQEANDNLENLVSERTKSLEEATALLKIATEGAKIGTWEQNLEDLTVTGNPTFFTNYGFPANMTKIDAEKITSLIDSSNTFIFSEEFKNSLFTDSYFDFEVLMNTLHEGPRFFHLKGVKIFDEKGKAIKMIGAQWDINDRKIAQEELNRVLHLTEKQNQRLKNFAYIVSHNLRSHSGNIQMLYSLFFDEHPEFKDYEIPKMIQRATVNLTETVKDLSQIVMSGLDDGQEFTAVNLSIMVEKAIDSISALSKNAGVTIFNEIPPDIQVLAIPAYIDSIVLNFLTNAIKYRSNERESFVRLSVSSEDDFNVLKIEDNGLGVDMDKYGDKLFGLYSTFHNHENSTGIGLYITKNQIENIGGRIEVDSKVNEGTAFKIYFKKVALS